MIQEEVKQILSDELTRIVFLEHQIENTRASVKNAAFDVHDKFLKRKNLSEMEEYKIVEIRNRIEETQ